MNLRMYVERCLFRKHAGHSRHHGSGIRGGFGRNKDAGIYGFGAFFRIICICA